MIFSLACFVGSECLSDCEYGNKPTNHMGILSVSFNRVRMDGNVYCRISRAWIIGLYKIKKC